ncbi:MAG: Xaa-Pro peptidase family protein [Rhodovibrionaceae bacterium]
MPLHFSESELASRRDAACTALQREGLDGLLIFRQETMFYLTGYDTFGYVFFQCLYLGADGRYALMTRAPDLRQAQRTSCIEDIRIWVDGDAVNPADQLKEMLQDFGCANKTLGVEYEAYGLTGYNAKRLDAALEGYCKLRDASWLVSRLRVIKSPAEIAYVREAAKLADDAYHAGMAEIRAGAFEGEILAAMQGAVFKGGGDYPGNEFIIGSGPEALLCRYFTGRRHLDPEDQLTLEWAGVYRRYHAAMMRTVAIGRAPARQNELHAAASEALQAVEARLSPGNSAGQAFAAHAEVLDKAGLQAHRLNACGYSLGTTFAPNWMDWPMLYRDNPVEIAPGMVFFVHIIIFDSEQGVAMSLGRTFLVGESGAEILSAAPLDFLVM